MIGTVSWETIAVRLGLTILAGLVIGFNRGAHGEAAGLRTTLLVCLAASVAMLQTNLLLGTAGKPSDSYVVLDLMRLPLGILTGIGFIGAGAIFRQDDMVRGITTAATLWFVTVIGLCFGGGQLGLGALATAIGLAVLWGLKAVEQFLAAEKAAQVSLVANSNGPSSSFVRGRFERAGFRVVKLDETFDNREDRSRTIRCHVRWRSRPHDVDVPAVIAELAKTDGVLRLQWKP